MGAGTQEATEQSVEEDLEEEDDGEDCHEEDDDEDEDEEESESECDHEEVEEVVVAQDATATKTAKPAPPQNTTIIDANLKLGSNLTDMLINLYNGKPTSDFRDHYATLADILLKQKQKNALLV